MANAAINVALVAAAQQQAQKEQALLNQLKDAGALSPRRAIELDLSAKGSDQLLKALAKRTYVRDAGGGRYWLDQDAEAAFKAKAKNVSLIVIAALLSITASMLALVLAFSD